MCISLGILLTECNAQDKIEKTEGFIPVFPKTRQLRMSRKDNKTKVCDCPSGIHTMLYAIPINRNAYSVESASCVGFVFNNEILSLEEVKKFKLSELSNSPSDRWKKLLLASAFEHDQDFRSALEIYNQLLTFDKADLAALLNRASVKLRLDYTESALIDLADIEEINRNLYEIPALRGVALAHLNKYDLALQEYERALEKAPTASRIVYFKAYCYFMQRDWKSAIKSIDYLINQGYDLHRYNVRYLRARAWLSTDNTDYDKCIQDLKVLIDKDKEDPLYISAVIDLAFLNSTRPDTKNRNPSKALELLNSIKDHKDYDKHLIEIHLALALTKMAYSNYKEAEKEMVTLKNLYMTEADIPDLKLIQQAINMKKPYIPKSKIPLGKHILDN